MTTNPASGPDSQSISPPTIPPARYWPRSPTYNHWVKLSAHDIAYTLRSAPGFEGQSVLFYLNSPIQYVYVTGAVQSVDLPSATTALLVLDDGSGVCLESVVRGGAEVAGLTRTAHGLALDGAALVPGCVVKAKGTFGAFKGVRQLELRRISLVRTTGEEVAAWRARGEQRRELERGWTLSAEEREEVDAECRKAAEREKRSAAKARVKKEGHEKRKREREARREARRHEEEKRLDAGALI